MATEKQSLAKKFENTLEYFIFASRWVQAPIYVALIVAAVAYAWKSMQELLHLLTGFSAASESSIMVGSSRSWISRWWPTWSTWSSSAAT